VKSISCAIFTQIYELSGLNKERIYLNIITLRGRRF